VVYDRAHHREINRFGGLWLSMPVYGSLATVGFFASLGLPALCGFIGEVYSVFGAFSSTALGSYAKPFAIIAASGVILTAAYILWLLQRVYLGKERPEYAGFPDATAREIGILAPMAVLAIALGILPKQTVFDFVTGSLNSILALAGAGAG
jgi:NADH-quinone oxidoreductase subunit M